ncbi:MAG: ribbon-helix-helix protein, CopG family [Bacteroidetes bacterium]|nr:ribbon-helix-helix protein, CopG family [Bacteroidota bacterium]
MERTQIYLTKREREALASIARESGVSQSALIRQAVDEFLTRNTARDRLPLIREARGLWKDHDDLPDTREMREEFDRPLFPGEENA